MKTIEFISIVLKSRLFAYSIVVLMTLFAFSKCQSNKDLVADKTKTEQNLTAANDTIKVYKTKYGTVVSEKQIYIKSISELKKENNGLYKQVKEQKGNVISLNNALLLLKQDTTILRSKLRAMAGNTTKIDSTHFRTDWELIYNWDSKNFDVYKGSTYNSVISTNPLTLKHDKTELTSRTSQINLTFGEKVVDGKYKVYVESEYPGLTTASLEGVLIDPNTNKDIKKLIKKQHWFTGFSFGVSVTPGYNLIDNKFGITVGPSLTWNIFNW